MSGGPIPLPILLGGALGAVTNKKNPLAGMAMGALGGFAGGQIAPMLGIGGGATGGAASLGGTAAAAANPAGAGVALEALYGGVSPAVAAQMSGLPMSEMAATQAAMNGMGATAGGQAGGLLGMAPNVAKVAQTSIQPMQAMQLGSRLMQPQPQAMPAPPQQIGAKPQDWSDLYKKRIFNPYG